MRYMITHRINTSDEDVAHLWQLLSGGAPAITLASVERALYEMAFRRRHFAHEVHTDHMCIDWIMFDLSLLLYPFCALLIANMWGYDGAFDEGVDMLKTYVLAASVIAAQLRERVSFMITMAVRRPYDIGDVLLVNGAPYSVLRFTPSQTHLRGNTALTVKNSVLLGGSVVNLTRSSVSDGVQLALPISAANDCVQRAREALEAFAAANPEVMDAASIRVGWASVVAGRVKLLSCNWAYAFEVHDVDRFLRTQTRVADHLVSALNGDASLAGLGYAAAKGGAFNSNVPMQAYILQEQNALT